MSTLQFTDYFLNEISYKRNPNFDSSIGKINLQPEISAQLIIKKEENIAYVNLQTRQGDLNAVNSAFELIIDIVGEFKFEYDSLEFDIEFETFLKENGLAILWSYIRPMVSDLITRGNQFPNFILPVINVKKMLEDNEAITVIYQ
ncbi:protein-export chaperone SecB [Aerococcaceae bacterium zg-ZJ1578]|uniref:preprotein translocase subunit SecB n=1 Tax=Aerococcaceae bacterium zg-252 TaxID=2796928 RepID=UPI001A320F9D|nr:protein-export chaperone SecB [Aerococcaceae bacterium zg-1578]